MKIRFIFAAAVSLVYFSEGHCGGCKSFERFVSKARRDVEHVVQEVKKGAVKCEREVKKGGRIIERETRRVGQQIEGEIRCFRDIIIEYWQNHDDDAKQMLIAQVAKVITSYLNGQGLIGNLSRVTKIVIHSIERLEYKEAEVVSEDKIGVSDLLTSMQEERNNDNSGHADAICNLVGAYIMAEDSSDTSAANEEITKYLPFAAEQTRAALESDENHEEEIAEHSRNNMSSSE